MSESKSTSSGIGFFGALTILFIGLKLGKVIDWSWTWVLSPLWLPFAIAVPCCLIGGIIYIGIHNRKVDKGKQND